MSDASPTPLEWSDELLARIEAGIQARGWRILKRIRTPDRVQDWMTSTPDGEFWLIRAICPPLGHLIGLDEIQGVQEALAGLSGWSIWVLAGGPVAPEALSLATSSLRISDIEAIFLQPPLDTSC